MRTFIELMQDNNAYYRLREEEWASVLQDIKYSMSKDIKSIKCSEETLEKAWNMFINIINEEM